MKNLVALLLVLTMALPWGCSYPDDENWDALRHGISVTPAPSLSELKRWTASEHAVTALSRHHRGKDLLMVTCAEEGVSLSDTLDIGAGDFVQKVFTVGDMITCIVDVGARKIVTFDDCIKILTEGVKDRLGASFTCTHELLSPFDDVAKDPKLDPEQIADDDVSEMLVKTNDIPPAWIWKALGATVVVIGVGVVMVYFPPAGAALGKLAPLLCTLRAEGGQPCPASPFELPGETPQTPQGDP